VIIAYRRFGTTYRTHPQGSRIEEKFGILKTEVGTDRLYRNVDKVLPLAAEKQSRRGQFSVLKRDYLNVITVVTEMKF
jgi:hypothetical protein